MLLKKLVSLIFVTLVFFGTINSQSISPAARDYLEKALDIMEKNSLYKREVNWAALRRRTLDRAKGAQETIDAGIFRIDLGDCCSGESNKRKM